LVAVLAQPRKGYAGLHSRHTLNRLISSGTLHHDSRKLDRCGANTKIAHGVKISTELAGWRWMVLRRELIPRGAGRLGRELGDGLGRELGDGLVENIDTAAGRGNDGTTT
jgi:hypothetical protein